jgi:Sel1 repeat
MRWAVAVLLIAGVGVAVAVLSPEPLRNKVLCASGVAKSCFNLGAMHEQGRGVVQNKAEAARLYRKACDGGAAAGCFSLGVMHDQGDGAAKDLSKAAELFRRACDGAVAEGCFNLGVTYGQGKGVAKDTSKAAQLFRQACDMQSADGCYGLALCYEEGEGIQQDQARADGLLKTGCDKGHVESCVGLARREPKLAAALARAKVIGEEYIAEESQALKSAMSRPPSSESTVLALERGQRVQAITAAPQLVVEIRRAEIMLRLAKTTTAEASAARAEGLRVFQELRKQDEDFLLAMVNTDWHRQGPSFEQQAALEKYRVAWEAIKEVVKKLAKDAK